jgi:hypothetical protein
MNEILLALGLCDKAQIEQAAISSAGSSATPRSYMQMLSDYESSKQTGDNDASALLVDRGIISTGSRDSALRMQDFLRDEHEAQCPAAQFRRFQDLLRTSWHRLLGDSNLDEATAKVSQFSYAAQSKITSAE